MRTTNILNEISDGKLYDIEDMVKADTCGCNGCSDCCNDVGDLVVLTPFDIYEMTTYLNTDFDKPICSILFLILLIVFKPSLSILPL